MKKKKIFFIVALIIIPFIVELFHTYKKLPKNISYEGDTHKGNFVFLSDLTYQKDTKKKVEQEIFQEVFRIIEESDTFVLLDFFLYNDDAGVSEEEKTSISKALTKTLLEKKKKDPQVDIFLITDPINGLYNGYELEQFKELEKAGIQVVTTKLPKLRDSNPIYSAYYRTYLQWIPVQRKGYLPNLFDKKKPKVSVASYLDLLNFKANHRKLAINEKSAVVLSANPHDRSYYHSNIGFKVDGPILNDILESEKAVLQLSGVSMDKVNQFKPIIQTEGKNTLKLVTEKKIQKELIHQLNTIKEGSKVKIGIFYISDRKIIQALKRASDRGVSIQIIMDLNKDAFGREKNGIPNKVVANELEEKENIEIKWYETQGEQFHSKFMILEEGEKVSIIGGSANYTRRNMDNFNLETDILVSGQKTDAQIQKIIQYYDRMWNNVQGEYTKDYEVYKEESWFKTMIYFFQEISGLSTF